MQLYTTLLHLKRVMAGESTPAFTPISESAAKVVDPAFVPGMGALIEDADKGLRCPVRGCGEYHHNLGSHIHNSHKAVGGVRAVRSALSIPQTVGLISTVGKAKIRAPINPAGHMARMSAARGDIRRKRPHRRETRNTVGFKNLRDSCMAQLSHKMIDLQNRLGRSPTADEARDAYGPGFVTAVVRAFGTWANAKSQCGLEVLKPGRRARSSSDVLPALEAYYEAHGELPSVRVVMQPKRGPLLPGRDAILNAFGARSWPHAMQIAASLLNIYGGRYGLPERKQSA